VELGARSHDGTQYELVDVSSDVSRGSASDAQNASDEYLNCSSVGVDCTDTQCCKDEGFQCFEKNLSYSGCLAECYSGMMPWTCAVRSTGSTPQSTTSRQPSSVSSPRSTPTHQPSTTLSTSPSAASSSIDQLSAQVATSSKLFAQNTSKNGTTAASSVLLVAFDALEEELEEITEMTRLRMLNSRASHAEVIDRPEYVG